MKNDELSHYGILGQKWGVRRFQPYPKGHKNGKEIGEARKAKRKKFNNVVFTQNIKNGKDKPNISPGEKVLKDTKNIINSTRDIAQATKRIKDRHTSYDRSGLSKMSDKELRDTINRLNLEKQYINLTEKDTSKGFETAMDIIDLTGGIVGIAAGTAGIMATIYGIKKLVNKDEKK